MRKLNLKSGKKGDLLTPESLKMIIAVLCIVLLLYLAFRLYSLFSGSTELEQAKATVNNLNMKAEQLKDGESTDYTVQGLKLWSLFSFPDGNSIKQCVSAKCLCVCPISSDKLNKQQICDSDGKCANSNVQIIVSGDIITLDSVVTKIRLVRSRDVVTISKA